MDQSTRGRQTEPDKEKKSILSVVSMPAVLAGVLTSVTSFLFSSKLGLTGSLIGAALAAAVSTTASQLYNAMINSSVEKIQDLSEHIRMHNEEIERTAEMGGVEKTEVRPQPVGYYDPNPTSQYDELETPVAPDELIEEAERRHRATIMRRTFIVAVVAALVALLAYSVIVNVATQGQGIGPTSIEEITQPAPTTEAPEATETVEAEQVEETDTATTTNPTTTVSGTTPSTEGTTDSSTQGTQGSTSGTTDQSTSGSTDTSSSTDTGASDQGGTSASDGTSSGTADATAPADS